MAMATVNGAGGIAVLRSAPTGSLTRDALPVLALRRALDAEASMALSLLSTLPLPTYGASGRVATGPGPTGSQVDVTVG
jgi:hypothetical protein